jgi:hypothetical protein
MAFVRRIFGAALLLLGASAAAGGQITNYTTPGNLKAAHTLGCIGLKDIRNEDTPPDLMNAYTACIAAKRYDDAILLWTVAGTYAYFDALRVPDVSAHDAFQVLMLEHQPGPDDGAKLRDLLAKYRAAGGKGAGPALCSDIKRLGAPSYRPDYMIAHGMSAFVGGAGGAPAGFDAKKGWRDTLDKYLHCDVSDMNG